MPSGPIKNKLNRNNDKGCFGINTMNQKLKITNETKVGILTIVTIFILIIGYNFLKGNDIFSNEDTYYAKYDRVNGLSVSKPVLINGFPIGRVAKLALLPNGQILAQFKIHHGYKIPQNTIARLENTDLLGGKAIVFILGNNNLFAKNGDTLNTNVQKNVIEQVEPIQQKAAQIISRLDSVLASVNSVINPEFQRNFDRSFASIAKILQTLEGTSKKVDEIVGNQSVKIGNIFGNVESVSLNLKNNNDKISSIITNLNQVSNDISKANLSQTLTQTGKTIAELQLLLNKINTNQGSLGLLVNDKQLYTNLTHASDNLDKLMIDLKTNPKRYINFSIFGGSGSKKTKNSIK